MSHTGFRLEVSTDDVMRYVLAQVVDGKGNYLAVEGLER